MTGYSTARVEEPDFSLAASVKSTNHRYLDLQLRYPAGLESFEPALRVLVKGQIARGHLEVTIALERAGAAMLRINRGMLEAYVSAFRELRLEFGKSSEPDLMALLRVPGMMTGSNGEFQSDDLKRVGEGLSAVVADALQRLNDMRSREGEILEKDLRDRTWLQNGVHSCGAFNIRR